MFKNIIALFIVLLSISACKKYEDDPASSRLLTVKLRMVLHNWKHAYIYNYITGEVFVKPTDKTETGFSETNDFSSTAYYLFEGNSYRLIDHKNKIIIGYRNGQEIEFKITTLTWNSFDFENDSIKISLTRK